MFSLQKVSKNFHFYSGQISLGLLHGYIGVRGNVYFTSFPAEGDVELFFRLLLAKTGIQLSPSGFSAS